MSADLDSGIDDQAGTALPVWAAFGDLMSVLLGAFVLILVGVIALQLQLQIKLDEEIAQRKLETQRRHFRLCDPFQGHEVHRMSMQSP